MENQNSKVVIYDQVSIPDITPLPMGSPVMFFAPFIDVAIERGILRLKRFVQANPKAEDWVVFGWMDGGLVSKFIGMPIGAFRMIEGDVEFAEPHIDGKLKPCFAIPFERDWDNISSLCKDTLIQGYDRIYQEKKMELLNQINMVNVDPEK